MEEGFRNRLADYFTSAELVDLLDIPIELVLDFIDEYDILTPEKYQEVVEFINYGK